VRKNRDRLHTLKGERGKGRDAVNTSERETTNIYCLGVPEMLIDSLMLSSVYSCVEEPLRKTLSKYRS
jgi:hypothetical protein